ncbi:uncharacterized protein CEXT_791331 [Caerostris extrusa]|uniref:Uncharacterized protein n=1 Tax=Caerostris extrusa TaxID=172846 RepID=A0AAV4M790_CAEEX|nr:uncharacterized protein CEXT_791331 [Caerostris extrusa]
MGSNTEMNPETVLEQSQGSYGYTDNKGIARQVHYVADKAGFRAQVKTNEPGTANQNPAAVQVISNDPYSRGAAESMVMKDIVTK